MKPDEPVTTWTFLVDDDPIVLKSLRRYFDATEDIRVIGEAADGADALAQLEDICVDVVLADIHMPNMDGVNLLRNLQERPNPPAFVAITALDSDNTMLQVLASGGAGYILKSSRPQAIIEAVRDAVSGGTTVSPQSLTRLMDYLPADPPHTTSEESAENRFELTNVEREILLLLCQGMSNATIAKTLNYSESTVKKYVSQLIGYFGVSSRLSLAVSAIRSGW